MIAASGALDPQAVAQLIEALGSKSGGAIDQVVKITDLGLTAFLVMVIVVAVWKGLPRFLAERRKDREEACAAEKARLAAFRELFEGFGGRIASATEKQADAVSELAKIQAVNHSDTTTKIEAVGTAVSVVEQKTNLILRRLKADPEEIDSMGRKQ